MSKLVIVESPAKAKTIKKYLGAGYEVVASMGHVRDLPEGRLSVDVKNDFKPKVCHHQREREAWLPELKDAARRRPITVYLATDPDREGEAISWHLAYILGLDGGSPQPRQPSTRSRKHGVTEGHGAPAHHRPEPGERPAGAPHPRPPRGLYAQPLPLPKTIRRGLSGGPRAVRRTCASSWTARRRSAPSSPRNTGAIDARLIRPGRPQGHFRRILLRNGRNGKLKIDKQGAGR